MDGPLPKTKKKTNPDFGFWNTASSALDSSWKPLQDDVSYTRHLPELVKMRSSRRGPCMEARSLHGEAVSRMQRRD